MGRPRKVLALVGAVLVAGAGAAALLGRFSYAPMPDVADLANPTRSPLTTAFDILGRRISPAEAERLRTTEEGRRTLAPGNGAVAIDASVVARGREAFYRETFGNEVFLTDVMGMLDGAITPFEVVRAVAALKGDATTNLQVPLAHDIRIGERMYRKGERVPTGLDVPKGGAFIIGIKTFYDRGHLRMGITCALCHAAVDPASGKVVEGAPNADLNAGLLMALAKNSSAYFMHASVPEADAAAPGAGSRPALPDATAVEAATKAQVASWPPGSFDSSADRVTNPTSIPSSFSAYGEPYSWSGREAIGPFSGLSSLNNNVHAANSDTTQLAAASPWLFGLDPETYLGIVLRGAPEAALRYDPAGSRRPSEVLHAADPTPASPGLNSYAVLPTYPATNYITDNGLFASVPGEPANFANNAMSAFQNLLRPPQSEGNADAVRTGRAVFARAGCNACHSGPALTNHRVIPAGEIGTEPSRAHAGAKMEARLSAPAMFAPDTPFPLSQDPKLVPVPIADDTLPQVLLAWGQGGTEGGYKVPNLVGLAWTAPYLHDSGVSVGPDVAKDLGVPGTLDKGVAPDPANSLRALIDRALRDRVVAVNTASEKDRTARVTGRGHAYWVDEQAGFSAADQGALITYLLSIDRLTEEVQTP